MNLYTEMRREVERQKARHPSVRWWVGVYKMGGHGDHMAAAAFARAAGRHWAGRRPGTGVFLLTHTTGMPADIDICYGQPGITAALRIPEAGWKYQAAQLADLFDVFYEVQYVVRTRFRDLRNYAADQAEADQRLDTWRGIYDFFPHSNQFLDRRVGLDQWKLMSETSGLTVSPADLAISTVTTVVEGFGRERVSRDAVEGAVSLHNGEGGDGRTKTLPRDVIEQIGRELFNAGVKVVQLGHRDAGKEPAIRGAVDLRGLRLPETAAVLQVARLHVDVEGGLVYIRRAATNQLPPEQRPDPESVVFFGPTPPRVFGLPRNHNVAPERCANKVIGPHCWWSQPNWGRVCPHGHDYCINFPGQHDAVREVFDALEAQCSQPVPATTHEGRTHE